MNPKVCNCGMPKLSYEKLEAALLNSQITSRIRMLEKAKEKMYYMNQENFYFKRTELLDKKVDANP